MTENMPTPHLRRFIISGATCAGCVRKIENTLAKLEGVDSASINFADRSLSIAGSLASEAIQAAIEGIGYGAEEQSTNSLQDAEKAKDEQYHLEKRLLQKQAAVALLPGIAMMAWSLSGEGMAVTSAESQFNWGFIGLVTLFSMAFAGHQIFTTGWKSLRHFAPNMDTLVAIGTGTAWLYSAGVVMFYQVLPNEAKHVYFEASTMIIGFVNLGRLLEHNARHKTGTAIRALLSLQVKNAWLIGEDKETACPVEAVGIGKYIRVRPGETIPLDGEITEGNGVIDESMLSGEAVPVEKTVGDSVFAGCINGTSSFIMMVTARSNDSTLANIVRSVQQAQGAKPPIGQLADAIAAVFVPVILAIAIIAASLWWFLGPVPQGVYALVVGVSVLIIACPCALGLATPMSVMVGVGRAAQLGILIRNGDALQAASNINTIVIDKTGTLTVGKPVVSHAELEKNADKQRLFSLIRSLENHSEHPLANALITYCQTHGGQSYTVESVSIERGLGLSGHVDKEHVCIGSERYMASLGITVPAHQQDDGLSVVYVAINNQFSARIFFEDPLRDDSLAAVNRLQARGIECVIVSGDSETSVAAAARALGIIQYHARSLPEDKLAYIRSLQQTGKKVAMAGDGINDAPALAQADISFAMGSGTDVAVSSSDIALMRNALSSVADAIAVSEATIRNIKQNLFWAFAYNILSIPVAAGVLYPFTGELLNPMLAGAAMALSSVTVASNANRLRWKTLRT